MVIVVELIEVILYVQDMNSQVSFYRDVLGFQVTEPADHQDYEGVFWVTLATGACTLALHAGGERRLGEVRSPAPGVQVCDGLDPEGNRFSIESRA